jgi:hypothetical protein
LQQMHQERCRVQRSAVDLSILSFVLSRSAFLSIVSRPLISLSHSIAGMRIDSTECVA